MPKKSTTYGERLPWAIAEKLFGLAALRGVSGGGSTLSNWRVDGVPSHAVVKLLKVRGKGELGTVIEVDRYATAPVEVQDLHALVDELVARDGVESASRINGTLRLILGQPPAKEVKRRASKQRG